MNYDGKHFQISNFEDVAEDDFDHFPPLIDDYAKQRVPSPDEFGLGVIERPLPL